MSSTIGIGCPQLQAVEPNLPSDDPMRRQVWGILASLNRQGKNHERRVDQRYPYPHLIYLTPLGEDDLTPVGDSIVVVGKNLSEQGLGFFYHQPIPYRRVIASLEIQSGQWVGFLTDITWCRFTQHGWYDNGGRFLQAVPSPVPGLPR